jgi:hypothetical protein
MSELFVAHLVNTTLLASSSPESWDFLLTRGTMTTFRWSRERAGEVGFEQMMTCLTTRRQTTRRRADQIKPPWRRPAHGLENSGWRNPSWQAYGRELRNLTGPWPSEFYGTDYGRTRQATTRGVKLDRGRANSMVQTASRPRQLSRHARHRHTTISPRP